MLYSIAAAGGGGDVPCSNLQRHPPGRAHAPCATCMLILLTKTMVTAMKPSGGIGTGAKACLECSMCESAVICRIGIGLHRALGVHNRPSVLLQGQSDPFECQFEPATCQRKGVGAYAPWQSASSSLRTVHVGTYTGRLNQC